MDGLTDVSEQMFIFLVFILGLKDIFTTNSVIKAAFFSNGLDYLSLYLQFSRQCIKFNSSHSRLLIFFRIVA